MPPLPLDGLWNLLIPIPFTLIAAWYRFRVPSVQTITVQLFRGWINLSESSRSPDAMGNELATGHTDAAGPRLEVQISRERLIRWATQVINDASSERDMHYPYRAGGSWRAHAAIRSLIWLLYFVYWNRVRRAVDRCVSAGLLEIVDTGDELLVQTGTQTRRIVDEFEEHRDKHGYDAAWALLESRVSGDIAFARSDLRSRVQGTIPSSGSSALDENTAIIRAIRDHLEQNSGELVPFAELIRVGREALREVTAANAKMAKNRKTLVLEELRTWYNNESVEVGTPISGNLTLRRLENNSFRWKTRPGAAGQ